MPSPKDIEYIQELEYMKQIEYLQHQIISMEDEMGILKLAQENNKEVNEAPSPQPSTTSTTSPPVTPISPPAIYNEEPQVYHDYPSPISMHSVHELLHKKHHHHKHHCFESGNPHDPPHRSLDLLGPESLPLLNNPKYQRICNQMDNQAMDKENLRQEYCETFMNTVGQLQVRQLLKIEDVEATLSKKGKKPWTLTVKNGNMSIETHIKNHSELIQHLEGTISTSFYQKTTNNLPFPIHLTTDVPDLHPRAGCKNAIGVVLSVMIWRKYGKSRFKSMTKYTPTLMHYEKAVTKIQPAENIAHITMRLVHAYIQCLHLRFLYIHTPSFLRLFMKDEQHVMKSPVIMALCSLVAHSTCKHITDVIPNEALNDYGLYYFERARDLIEEEFDQVNLGTLFTYTFIAVYYLKTKEDGNADRYLCMAERIYSILLPQYQFVDGQPNSDEAILFARLYRAIFHTRSVIQMHEMMTNMYTARSRGPQQLFKLLDSEEELEIYLAYDDTPKEVAMIKMRRYLRQLREHIKEGARCAAASDFPTYVSVFGHHIEMAMRHWYRNVLPVEFQLSLPLFEDDTPAIEFFTKLELECGDSPVAILTTLSLYNEYLIMSKSYLPRDPDEPQLNTEDLLKRYQEMQHNIPMRDQDGAKFNEKTHHWIKIIERMMHVRKQHQNYFTEEELGEPDDQYFTRFIMALNPSKLNFDMPFIHTSVRTALNMVRIIQFLITREYSCYLDLRWVMNCWEVLLRAARFKYQQPGDKEVTLDRIRANLLLCIDIVKAEMDPSRRDSAGTFIEVMEQDFNKLF